MRKLLIGGVLGASLLLAQPAMAALVTLTFDGLIGPMTTPATLNGGEFDGMIRFDDAQPFPQLPALLTVTNGPLADSYSFGAEPGAFVPSAYRVTYTDDAFRFQGTSDDGASLNFNLTGNGSGFYTGRFAFAKGSDFAAVGDVTIGNAPPAAVPEPATWLTMIMGFGLIGLLARRRTAPHLLRV